MLHKEIIIIQPDGYRLKIDTYVPEVSPEIDPQVRRPSIVLCGGGGYEFISHRETEPVALDYAAHGFNVFVVWYRFSPNRFPKPVQDVAAAVAYVRAHAEELHAAPDQISVMGFSAGGHNAASLGVMWPRADLWAEQGLTPEQVRPNAMILCYPVISAGPKAHRGSFNALTGTTDIEAHQPYSLEKLVSDETAPAYIWHTWDDELVPVENTLLMATALREHDIPCEVHIFPHGPHGSSLCREESSGTVQRKMNLPDCEIWPEFSRRFLRTLFAK